MTGPQRVTSRGRVVRWPAILLLAAAAAVMVVVDGDSPARDELVAVERPVVPTSGTSDALSSTWYCAGGTVLVDGPADHEVVLANPSGVAASVRLTIFPVLAPAPIQINLDDATTDTALMPPEAVRLESVGATLDVLPRTVVRTRLADLEGVTGEHAAVLVEADAGDLVVEHVVSGPSGAGAAPCASASASSWYFAAGTTRKGARETLSIFNPFPGDAVVDLSFATNEGPRTPQIYSGLVVPSGSVLPVDITDVVTLFDSVSAALEVRTGRVVTDRLLTLDGSEGPGGVSVAVGSPRPAETWVFGSNPPVDAVDAIVIYNPSLTDEAQVDVEVSLDVPEFNGRVEPIGLNIRPGRTETVALTPGAELVSSGRVTDASERIIDGVGYWTAVRSLNGVPVVADHLTVAPTATPAAASASPGAPVAATVHMTPTHDGVGEVVLVNPAADRIAVVSLRLFADGQEFTLSGAEIAPRSRLVLDLQELGAPANGLLVIDSTEPVFSETRRTLEGAGSFTAQAVVRAGTTSRPDLPLP